MSTGIIFPSAPATLPFQPLADSGFGVLLTVSEVAAPLRVSRAASYGLVKRSQLPSVRVTNAIRVRRHDVEPFVE
jgi:excisionase family DNA binding protein